MTEWYKSHCSRCELAAGSSVYHINWWPNEIHLSAYTIPAVDLPQVGARAGIAGVTTAVARR